MNGQIGSKLQVQQYLSMESQPHSHHVSHQSETDYNSFTAPDGNIVWAGALTLAWKELIRLAGPQVKELTVPHGNQHLQSIVSNFNHSHFSKDDLDTSSYYVKSGLGQQTVEEINKERAEKFKECTFPPVNASLGPNDIISYAYLFKKVMYPYKFTKRQGKPFVFHSIEDKKHVESFYADDPDQQEQVRIYEYHNGDDFVISLKDAADHDEIFLYKAPKGKTVKDVIAHINILSQKKWTDHEVIMDTDKFEVPILNLDYSRTLQELVGAEIKEFQGKRIEEILEGVKLKLDESGAVVENEGLVMINECAMLNPQPKSLLLDKPFWVVMKEKKKHPYLCIQINNL